MAETATRVAVVDAAFESDGVESLLDLDADAGIRSVLRGDATLEEAMVTGPHGVDYLPAGSERPATTDIRTHRLARAARRLRERYDVVMLDLGTGGGVTLAMGLELADEAILVSGSAEDDLAATAETATVVRYHGCGIRGTVLSRVPSVQAVDTVGVTGTLETDLLAVVPDDDAVRSAAEAGQSLLRHDPDSDAAMVYWQLASTLTGAGGLTGPVLPASAADGDSETERGSDSAGPGGGSDAPADSTATVDAAEDDPGDTPVGEGSDGSEDEPESASDPENVAETGAQSGTEAGEADSVVSETPEATEQSPAPGPSSERTETTPEDTAETATDPPDSETAPEPAERDADDGPATAADSEATSTTEAPTDEDTESDRQADGVDDDPDEEADSGGAAFEFGDEGAETGADPEQDGEFELPGFDSATESSSATTEEDAETPATDDTKHDIDEAIDELAEEGSTADPRGEAVAAHPPDDDSSTEDEPVAADRDRSDADTAVESGDDSGESASTDPVEIDDSTEEGDVGAPSRPDDTEGGDTAPADPGEGSAPDGENDQAFEDVSPDPESLLDDEEGDEDDEINALFKETMDKVTDEE